MDGVRGQGAALSLAVIAVAAAVILAALAIPFLFLQYRTVDVREEQTIALPTGAERIELNVTATVGRLLVEFVDLPDRSARVVAEVKGHSGYFGEASPIRLDVTASNDTAQGGETVYASVRFDTYAPWPYYSLSETVYTLQLNRSLRADLNLTVTTGGVVLYTVPGVVLEGLRLNATNDGAVVSLGNGTILAGDIRIRTATGGTALLWTNVTVVGDRTVSLTESSGFIMAHFDQASPLGSDVSVVCKNTVGEIEVSFLLRGDVSAGVTAHGGIGGIGLVPIEGFSGTAALFASDNYPASSGFDARLNNTLGSIEVEGSWTSDRH